MADEKEIPTYNLTEYTNQYMEYDKPFNVDLTDPNRVLEATGINVSESQQQQEEEKLYTNPIINSFTKGNADAGLKVYTGVNTNVFGTYEDMLKHVGLNDKSGAFSTGAALAKGTLSSLIGVTGAFMGSGEYGFGKTFKGPTGKPVFSVGGLSEKALQRHFENFSQVQEANLFKELSGSNIKDTDTGFAMTVDNFHFSRKPGQMFFDGHKGHLSSDDGNAHAMQKTIEALSKGLDPAGYRLDGKNENNRGAAGGSSAGGRVTEDGYYTYVANNSFGYTKSVLYGGNLSDKLAQEFGTDGMTLKTAMDMARADKNLTVTQALKKLTTEEDVSDEIEVSTVSPESSGSSAAEIAQQLSQQAVIAQQEKDNRSAEKDENEAKVQEESYEQTIRRGGGFQEGGLIPDFATILKENRLGMNLGGQPKEQINLNEVGFVGDKTPNEVTPQQSIADDKPVDMRREDYLLNSPSVEKHGIRNVVNMVMRALKDASASGVEIVDMPADIPRDDLVKVLASASEFRIPRDLVPYIGLANLETINEKGKPEVKKRSRKLEDEMKELDKNRSQVQQAKEGGEVEEMGYDQISNEFKNKLKQFNKKKRNRTERDKFIQDMTDEEALALTFLTETIASTTSLPTMQKIGDVVMNRVNDRQFEFKNVNTIKDVLLQRTSRGTGTKMVAFDGLEPTSLNTRISEVLSGKAPNAIEKAYSAAINTLDTEPDLEKYRLPFNVMYYKKPNSGSSWHDNDPELSYFMQDGGHDFYGRHFGPETLGDEVEFVRTPKVNTN